MTLFGVALIVLVVLLTFVYRNALDGLAGQSGSDRSGNQIVVGFSLFLRWTCLAILLGMCAGRRGFGWPSSSTGQVALVLTIHTVLGLVSFTSAVLRTMHPGLSARVVAAMEWVPILLPACQLVAVATILFPDLLPPASLRPVRNGALLLVGLVGLIGLGVLTRMILREERQNRAAAVQIRQATNERE